MSFALGRTGSKTSKMSTSTAHYVLSRSTQPANISATNGSLQHPVDGIHTQDAELDQLMAEIDGEGRRESLYRPIIEGTMDASMIQGGKATIRLVSLTQSTTDSPLPNPSFTSVSVLDQSLGLPLQGDGIKTPESDAMDVDKTPTKPAPTHHSIFPGTPTLAPSPAPFVFGSPAHAVTNTQFDDAAAAVLAEMNRRLGVKPSDVGARITEGGKIDFGIAPGHSTNAVHTGNKKEEGGRFGKAHGKQFQK